eukprot:snap_masked-scaffold_11-processed-gene-2.1-mRNA-1 protein AED:1.00 eAED:1.00 QI:0/-1/0/0/-1/1/1/0/73
MDTKSTKTEELDLQQHSQMVPNDGWTVLRGSTPEIMFQALQTFAANRFRWKRTPSHTFLNNSPKEYLVSTTEC